MENLYEKLGAIPQDKLNQTKDYIHQYIGLRLTALGVEMDTEGMSDEQKNFIECLKGLLSNYKEREILYDNNLCPADERIQNFFDSYFATVKGVEDIKLPIRTFTLDSYGIARELSLPKGKDEYFSEYVSSYRTKQGVLRNFRNTPHERYCFTLCAAPPRDPFSPPRGRGSDRPQGSVRR